MAAETADDRPLAPFGRRQCEVTAAQSDGGYQLFTLADEDGPRPAAGQFYMLASVARWQTDSGRPFLPRAISVARTLGEAGGLRLGFLIDRIGPGTDRLAALEAGERCWVAGPFGNGFSSPKQIIPGAVGAVLVGGGIGIAPMALLRRDLIARGVPTRSLLGFRDHKHSGAVETLFGCEETRLAFEDGSSGHHGYVTDLLGLILAGDDPSGAVVYACGPPAMLEAVRLMCGESGVAAELALESPMACGFGACFGCAIPKADGGFLRLCVDGPVLRADAIATAMGGEAG